MQSNVTLFNRLVNSLQLTSNNLHDVYTTFPQKMMCTPHDLSFDSKEIVTKVSHHKRTLMWHGHEYTPMLYGITF